MSIDKIQATPVMQGSRTQGLLCFSYNSCTLKSNMGVSWLVNPGQGERNWENILRSLIDKGGMAIKQSTEVLCHKNRDDSSFCFQLKKIMQIKTLIVMCSPEHSERSFSGEAQKMRGELITCIFMVLWFCEAWENEDTNEWVWPKKSIQPPKWITCLQREILRKPCIWPGWRDIISAWEWLGLVPEVNLSTHTLNLSASASDWPSTCQSAFEMCLLCVEELQYLHQAPCSQECLDTQFLLKWRTQANEH